MIPLPLKSERWGTEVVRCLGLHKGFPLDGLVRLARHSVKRVGAAPVRPVVGPNDWTDERHAANGAAVLHDKPVVTSVREIHDRALVPASSVIDRWNGFPHAEDIGRARDFHGQIRRMGVETVIILAALEHLGAFDALIIKYVV